MNEIKVLIDNWPKASWYQLWIPIIIAGISLITSIIALQWTRTSFVRSIRPFVWANNYGVINRAQNNITPIPFRTAFRVKNTPAKILKFTTQIQLGSSVLFDYSENNAVQYPDESSEWTFTIGANEFDKIMDRPVNEKNRLVRIVDIAYSSLDGGKIYFYHLEQIFNSEENQWFNKVQTAD